MIEDAVGIDRRPTSRWVTSASARRNRGYRHLKEELDAGRITAERFEQALSDSMIESDGRYWMLGANTGRWYVSDGGEAWHPATPPTDAPGADAGAAARSLPLPPGRP
jgi:hypothetical protein